MKYISVVLFGLVGNAFAQQELNSIAKCIKDKNCGNDLACQQNCHSANTEVYDNILKVQKCLGSCDLSLPIEQYQKCVSLCNSNSGQAPSSITKDDGSKKEDKESDKTEKTDSSPTSTAGISAKPTSGSANSSAASNNTKSSNNDTSKSSPTSSKSSGSSSVTKLSASAIGLFMVTIFTML